MSEFITWSEKFNTGNKVIDYQHQRLVRLINDLNQVRLHTDLGASLSTVIFDEVENYTRYHFKTEEEIMKKGQYSDYDSHKTLHNEFVQKIAVFKAEYKNQSKDIDNELCLYLKYWLLSHIASEDPKMVAGLKQGE